MTSGNEKIRYVGLDALRGVAALVIVFVHAHDGLGGLPDPKSGYLAVDLFFLLSGFVIANAYDSRLAAGMSVRQFFTIRLIRLYPLYLVGIATAIVKLLIQFRVGVSPPPVGQLAIDTGFGLFMLPSPTTIGHGFAPICPLDMPAWSLFFEMVVNVIFALSHRWLSRPVLIGMVLILAGGLVGVVLFHGSLEVGNVWPTMIFGVQRAGFPFFLGTLLYRARNRLPHLGTAWAWGTMAALLLALMTDPDRFRMVYDLLIVAVFFPALVVTASAIKISGLTRGFSILAGELSYALYIVHLPVLDMLLAILKRAAPGLMLSSLSGPGFVISILSACWCIDRFYDRPIRQWLTDRLRRSRQHHGGQDLHLSI